MLYSLWSLIYIFHEDKNNSFRNIAIIFTIAIILTTVMNYIRESIFSFILGFITFLFWIDCCIISISMCVSNVRYLRVSNKKLKDYFDKTFNNFEFIFHVSKVYNHDIDIRIQNKHKIPYTMVGFGDPIITFVIFFGQTFLYIDEKLAKNNDYKDSLIDFALESLHSKLKTVIQNTSKEKQFKKIWT